MFPCFKMLLYILINFTICLFETNAPAADPEVYYRINLTRVFLDHCTQHIDRRFQNEVYSCYKGLYLVPKVMLSNAAVWKARVREFCNDYRQDIPNIAGLDGEFALWERMWRDQQNVRADPIPDRVSDTLAEVDKHAFCNIYTILQLLATLPMSSASCSWAQEAQHNDDISC